MYIKAGNSQKQIHILPMASKLKTSAKTQLEKIK